MAKAPLILIEAGYNRWTILEPEPGFNEPIHATGFFDMRERRYHYRCEVQGTLDKALAVLHDLEKAAR